jgi:hypothetical protein
MPHPNDTDPSTRHFVLSTIRQHIRQELAVRKLVHTDGTGSFADLARITHESESKALERYVGWLDAEIDGHWTTDVPEEAGPWQPQFFWIARDATVGHQDRQKLAIGEFRRKVNDRARAPWHCGDQPWSAMAAEGWKRWSLPIIPPPL